MRAGQCNSADKLDEVEYPDYADTVELCFINGPHRLRRWSRFMKFMINTFICVTQLGFCCIYFVFIATNFEQVCIFACHSNQSNLRLNIEFIFIVEWNQYSLK